MTGVTAAHDTQPAQGLRGQQPPALIAVECLAGALTPAALRWGERQGRWRRAHPAPSGGRRLCTILLPT
jgi:hypothetical protein